MNPPILPNHSDRKPHLLLCATGSVATIKIPLILSSLSHHTLSIRLILSPSATSFFTGKTSEQPPLSSLSTLPNVEAVYTDEDEWAVPWSRGEKILHIELRRWADIMVIAPLSANSLAKICGGWAEGLVGSVVRAWDTTGELDIVRYPLPSPDEEKEREEEAAECMAEGARTGVRKKHIIVAPSMNTAMWKQPITRKHIEVLEGEWGVKNGGWFEVLQPMEKELACGDVGGGAMKDWREIVGVIEDRLNLRNEAQAET
ncbi:flavo protein [Delitschia confertaspora ATCC 74209]|uniref:Flavo protein n=1 Tax=Delitschia confertaspora ATCC 74209 TaxID=1513339 RepID=A0A9P4JEE1_9PLEO|nr:flavo protein [Delitschia confertaspora ATCC 74209]